jgi:transcriptional regulator NrdR family protein
MQCPTCGAILLCKRTKSRKCKTSRLRECEGCASRYLTVEKVRYKLRKRKC